MDTTIDEDTKQKIIRCSTFVLDTAFWGKEKMREKLLQLEQDIRDGPDANQEKIQLCNFIAYLHWRLGERQEAFGAIKEAEDKQDDPNTPNLITLCNKIVFYIELGDYYQSKTLSDNLQNDRFKQKSVRIQADAEIAYYYSRSGPIHHEKAVSGFKKAIKDISPERNILWEYALAQTLRRQSNMHQMLEPKNFSPEKNQKEAASLLYGIIRFSSDGYSQTKAKAWCEISRILMSLQCDNLYDIIEAKYVQDEKIDETRCFKEALKLRPKGYFVLYSYGRHLRYRNELERSKDMLEMAIRERDECSSRHHLALTLQKMVETENKRPTNEKVFQSPSSIEAGQRLLHVPYDSGLDDKSKQFSSLSIHSESNEYQLGLTKDKIIQENDTITYKRLNAPELTVDHQSDSKNQKHTFRSSRKSPRSVCISPNNPLLLEAVDHLKMALQMKTGFDVARYDLGLIYRMLAQPEEALKCFTGITSNIRGKPSEYPLTLINAYEQQAICKLEMIEKESDTEKIHAMECDAWAAMWKAVTLVSGVIRALPMLRTTTECFPMLKMVLQNDKKSTHLEILKGLAKLHELLNMYNEESLKLYEKISELDEDPQYTKKIIENCLKLGDFEKAICLLSYLERTEKKDVFDKSFYVNTYINGAKEALNKGDFDMAKIRFCKGYHALLPHLIDSSKGIEICESPLDVLVLDGCDESDNCCWIKSITYTLEWFLNLQVAVNHRDCLPNRYTHAYLESKMEEARCIFIVQHEFKIVNTDPSIDYALNALAKTVFRKILLFRVGECGQSSSGFKEFSLPMDNSEIADDKVKQGVFLSEVLFKIADLFSENC